MYTYRVAICVIGHPMTNTNGALKYFCVARNQNAGLKRVGYRRKIIPANITMVFKLSKTS